MNASLLKHRVENRGTESHYFTRSSMKFFGDTMRNYGVRSCIIRTNYNEAGDYVTAEGREVECWELYRKRAVKHGLKDSVFFDKTTFQRVHKSA